MAGSRAASAREPGQIREEAALSDTARAPRISLAGADDRRARPGTSFEGGCTVRFLAPMDNADLIRQLAERWNAVDIDGAVDLYAEDAVIVNGADWPEQARWEGRDRIRQSMEEWGDVWQSAVVEMGPIERYGDRILATGTWRNRGMTSGVEGSMPFSILFTFRDGKIAVHEWFTDHDAAVAAARDA
jgi:ketosteroid isomerase-like protein